MSKDGLLFIVADGVGGMPHSETASFALTHLTKRLYEDGLLPHLLDSSEILIKKLILFLQRFHLTGSTTFAVIQIIGDMLHVLNIGDCSCMVLRGNDIILLTQEQWFRPDTPFQLHGYSYNQFSADLAARYIFPLQKGDRILLYSDGIGDNVWPRQMSGITSAEQLFLLARRQATGSIGADIPFNCKMGPIQH
jgi:serine/threonine protein phosphatase PrpC